MKKPKQKKPVSVKTRYGNGWDVFLFDTKKEAEAFRLGLWQSRRIYRLKNK
jgi:hypothetical protein